MIASDINMSYFVCYIDHVKKKKSFCLLLPLFLARPGHTVGD